VAISRPSDPYPDHSPWGWGDAAQVPALPENVVKLLGDALGVRGPTPPPESLSALTVPPGRLGAGLVSELSAASGFAIAEDEARIRHTRGKSTTDLLRLRAGELLGVPDLVLEPASHEQVLEVLRICSRERVAVVPFGGGTSVVGGLEAAADGFAGLVALDLRRMNALVAVDAESRLAVLEPGLRGPEAEQLLGEHGFTIGHFPQSFEYATLGGFAAARSSGQASAGYGRFDDLVLSLQLAAPAGTLSAGRAPKSAAGPDLRQLILGSEGTLGVITSLTVQVRPAPDVKVYEGWRFGSFWDGVAAVRGLVQDGPLPTVLRLSDEAETALNLARPGELGRAGAAGCLAIVGYEGTRADVEHRRAGVHERFGRTGAALEADAGERWAHDRYRGPYVRDAMLDAGALVDTLETVAFWSALKGVYKAVSGALRETLTGLGSPPVILCHVSHVYASGASLYFTVGCAQLDDPVAQWRAAKAAAGDAIIAAGGSITHHHGVGTDHRQWYAREVGELGLAVLRAAKATLDPAGIMNPGVLLEGGRLGSDLR
jgi:alkyldihydroxyacetonephosphate synthase